MLLWCFPHVLYQINIQMHRRSAGKHTCFKYVYTLQSMLLLTFAHWLARLSLDALTWSARTKKWKPFWLKLKFTLNQSSGISEMQVHACTQIHLSFLLPVDGSPRGLRAPKCCFSSTLLSPYPPATDDGLLLSRCSGFSLGLWLKATPSPLPPFAAALTTASAAQGILQRTFSLLSPHVCWAAVPQEDARGGWGDAACALV